MYTLLLSALCVGVVLSEPLRFIPHSPNIECPGGEAKCPSESTCFKLKSGAWGCCPKPNAVCCSDGVHCCPQGYTCDLSTGKCAKGNTRIRWFEKFPASTKMHAEQLAPKPKLKSKSIDCPNKQQCPDLNTCCATDSGSFGCCPTNNATCCSDKKTCCPQGYICMSGGCEWNESSVNSINAANKPRWTDPLPVKHLEAVVCPDGKSECPAGNTCCKLQSGQYGCCPLPKAVCCSDHTHCCPNGYTCDVATGTCSRGNIWVGWVKKVQARQLESANVKIVVCPGGHQQCPSGNTCCPLSGDEYGCCPEPNAVCCPDKKHCCPEHHTCNPTSGQCVGPKGIRPWMRKMPAMMAEPVLAPVICPGGEAECPSGNTCCKLASGIYGCCPKPNAVCCKDEKHCCPHGYTCDVGTEECAKGGERISWWKKQPAKERKVTASVGIICPGGTAECPAGNTCCELSTGQYGCCPLPNAVCCSDGQHCCPQGYTCDVGAGTCAKGGEKITWSKKEPAKERKGMETIPLVKKQQSTVTATNVLCPDGQSQCPSGNTCCKLKSGAYGCCPIPKAVCCSDGQHCCPHGYTCDAGAGTCTKGMETIPLVKKQQSTVTATNVLCPDGQSQCPSGNTCCKLKSGAYGCCPLPKAVCCSDEQHCCPNGYKCSSGTCKKGDVSIEMFRKTKAMPLKEEVPVSPQPLQGTSIICPDKESECPAGNTCCIMTNGEYGCCPNENAVCCEDRVHCCPQGMTCDMTKGQCTDQKAIIPWFTKQSAKKTETNDKIDGQLKSIVCPDNVHLCPDDSTCCKMSGQKWGCCPMANAFCCHDGEHCCPEGYECILKTSNCERKDRGMKRLLKIVHGRRLKPKNE